MTKRSKIRAFVALAIPVAVLGYGYWFNATHGSLYFWVDDVSDRERPKPVPAIDVSFLDANGQTLAEARGGPPYGTTSFSVNIALDRRASCESRVEDPGVPALR